VVFAAIGDDLSGRTNGLSLRLVPLVGRARRWGMVRTLA